MDRSGVIDRQVLELVSLSGKGNLAGDLIPDTGMAISCEDRYLGRAPCKPLASSCLVSLVSKRGDGMAFPAQ
jgi:hypothetical protein